MKGLQPILDTIGRQVRGLSPSNKLLIGSLAVIGVMALFIVALYGGRSTMSPLPVPVTPENRGRVVSYLESRGIPWAEEGGQLVVPVEKKHLVLAELTDQEIIAPDQIDFDQLVQQESPFLSKAQNERRWLIATMNQLSRTVSRMQGISRAVVVIDEPSRPGGLGAAHREPSASVTVEMAAGALGQEQVDAIAAMVAGAHAELTLERVEVIDARAGRAFRAATGEAARATRYLELQREHAAYYEQKIVKALAHIPSVNVAVNVIVDHREVVEQSRRFDDPKVGVTRESMRTVSSTNRPASLEPGVRSNAGASIAGGRGVSSTYADERSDTAMEPAFGGTDSRTRDPGGFPLKINAAIGIPRSYFVHLLREQSGDGAAAPTPEEIQAMAGQEIPRIQAHLQPLIDAGPKGGQAVGTVAVSMIPDRVPLAVEAGGAVTGVRGLVSESLVKYTGLGGLALLSLLMMFMMVRRASVAADDLPSGDELAGEPAPLAVQGEVFGEAMPGSVPMEGVEVDESTVRRQQMVEQIHRMAGDDPAEAARILRRWAEIDE